MTHNESEFLTTSEKCDLAELFAKINTDSGVLVVLSVEPRDGRTGLLDERGAWVLKVWNAILGQMPEIHGQRLGWSELVFFCSNTLEQVAASQFGEILRECKEEKIRSVSLISEAADTTKGKLTQLDEMLMSVNKRRYYFNSEKYKNWLVDGDKIEVSGNVL